MDWTGMTERELLDGASKAEKAAWRFLYGLTETYSALLTDEEGKDFMTTGEVIVTRFGGVEERVYYEDLCLMDVPDLLTKLVEMEAKDNERKRAEAEAKKEERKRINRVRAKERRQLRKLGEW